MTFMSYSVRAIWVQKGHQKVKKVKKISCQKFISKHYSKRILLISLIFMELSSLKWPHIIKFQTVNVKRPTSKEWQWICLDLRPAPIGAPIEYACSILHVSDNMELPHTTGHTSNPWNKCPKRGLLTMGGQIPIEKHYHSFKRPIMTCQLHTSSRVL